jgi:hypothetical protein
VDGAALAVALLKLLPFPLCIVLPPSASTLPLLLSSRFPSFAAQNHSPWRVLGRSHTVIAATAQEAVQDTQSRYDK